MDLFQLGDFTLNSGAKSGFKIECDALSDGEINTLAKMIATMVGPFKDVTGVSTGGLKLAAALKPMCSLSGPHLIVDDVLTTGGSMQRLKDTLLLEAISSGTLMAGAVIFAGGQCPWWVKALFQMPECFWLSPRHC